MYSSEKRNDAFRFFSVGSFFRRSRRSTEKAFVFSLVEPLFVSRIFDPIFPIQKKKKGPKIGFIVIIVIVCRRVLRSGLADLEKEEHVEKNRRLHDARVHRGVHIPRLAGGVLSHGCVFRVVFLSLFFYSYV